MGKQHARRASGAPPPSPSPCNNADPAIDELKQQWNWGFNHRRNSVTCMVCGREVEPAALEGHLKLCSAGGRHHATAHRKAGIHRPGDGGGTKDPLLWGTRHDPDFRNEGLHKKKWASVLDEEGGKDGPGLVPEYDAARGGIRLKLYTAAQGLPFKFSAEEHFFPSEGGALGGGAFGKGPWSRIPSNGTSTDRSAHPGAEFWAKHESRRRAQDVEFEQGAKAFEHARRERMQREVEERERAERRRQEEEEARVRALREADEARKVLCTKAAEYEAIYQNFEGKAKRREVN